jgi:hypothetical protein
VARTRPLSASGPDWASPVALLIVPLAVAAAFTRSLLAGEWLWPLLRPLCALLLIGLRPAVWGVAS